MTKASERILVHHLRNLQLGGVIKQCCKCHRIKFHGEWIYAPLNINTSIFLLTHGYCPRCLQREQVSIKEFITNLREKNNK